MIKNEATPSLIDTCLQSICSLSTVGFPSSAEGLTDFLDSMEAGSEVLDRFVFVMCWPNEDQCAENCKVIEGLARTANEELWRQVPGSPPVMEYMVSEIGSNELRTCKADARLRLMTA